MENSENYKCEDLGRKDKILKDGTVEEDLKQSNDCASVSVMSTNSNAKKRHCHFEFDELDGEPVMQPKRKIFVSSASDICNQWHEEDKIDQPEKICQVFEKEHYSASVQSQSLIGEGQQLNSGTDFSSSNVRVTKTEKTTDEHGETTPVDCANVVTDRRVDVRSDDQNTEQEKLQHSLDDCHQVLYVHSEQLINHCNRLPRIPDRAGIVHSLIESLGLLKFLQVVPPRVADEEEVMKFHSKDYVEFLQHISHLEDEEKINLDEAEQYGMTYDCPLQEGVYECAALVAGATVTAAQALCDGQYHVAINWCGGWHHAQRSEASGFCYINDIVLGIQTLRDKFSRVLYVDLDLHHGDGVENAFSTTSHVLTVSFHKYGTGFFPGSGSIKDVGFRGGKYYSINVPMKDGLRDKEFFAVFRRVMKCVHETYDPEVIVCQCGADGLAGDPMASFNLTLTGYRHCLYFLMLWKLPLLLLGGGGYHHANTARCWASLTALTVGRKLPQDVPDHKNFTEYGPDYELTVEAGNRKDQNSSEYLLNICRIVTENLQKIKGKLV